MLVFINILSFLRVPLAFMFLYENFIVRIIAISCAMLTDILDGYLARQYKMTSRFGAVCDPIVDKFFVCFVCSVFLYEQKLVIWQMVLLVFRDFGLLFFGIYIIYTRNWHKISFKAAKWGKVTTFAQFGILVGLIFDVVFSWYLYLSFIILGILTLWELYVQIYLNFDSNVNCSSSKMKIG